MKCKITSPEEFFGFKMGSDRKIARWDRIVEYFQLLQKQSSKIKVVNMGETTMGNPFLLVIISSEKNIKKLDELKEINAKISDPRGIDEEEIKDLIKRGKAVICIANSIHATEIGGTQMAPELAYDLISKDDDETKRILENVIFLLIPCTNPDGQIMVTDWYNKWLGTEYEGCPPPWLYHKYAGHDNNRDGFMLNLVETRYMARILFKEWHPQAYMDHHHMGSYGARFFIPPYANPIQPYADPLVWREHHWYGAHMAYKLEEAGKRGVLTWGQFPGYGPLGLSRIGNWHNIASFLTESASARLATPIYIHKHQLTGGGEGPYRGFGKKYAAQTNFPSPWLGGWWRLRDIVEQMKIASWAMLDLAAKNKDEVLWAAYLKAKRQIERGVKEKPFAYIIPVSDEKQHDPLTAHKLVYRLLLQGVEVKKALKEFKAGERTYDKGSYVIFMQQPKRGLIKTLLDKTRYPENEWTVKEDGTPIRPQDTATNTMAEYMGVRVDPIDEPFEGEFETIEEFEKPKGRILGESTLGYVFDGKLNDSYIALNRLLNENIRVWRIDETIKIGSREFQAGAFMVKGGCEEKLKKIAEETGVDFIPVNGEASFKKHEVKRLRIAIYQRYYGGNMDEGWTRYVLEEFEFPYHTIKDEEVKKGKLREKYDVIIIPNDPEPFITGEKIEEYFKEKFPGRTMPKYPPQYKSGIGKEGVEALKKFVEEGGILVTFGEACNFAIDKMELPILNVVKDLPPKEFFCPGSTLHAIVDNENPLGYGMPKKTLIFFWNNPVFTIAQTEKNEEYEIIVRYPERDLEGEILQSGWLIGEEKIEGKAAMVNAKKGEGKVILIGFRVQHRGQTHGTFKLLFNCLIN
ncbi:MAG: M14 family zinc carboxypeptidase [archaeon GB-1867-097]|nr:peptidase M14 family protein [Candidatus Verstraetearchaeota archaeon]MCS7384576.1 M14 family zinc carboxypeptidase [Candidatus Culexmicrobium thermophilum]